MSDQAILNAILGGFAESPPQPADQTMTIDMAAMRLHPYQSVPIVYSKEPEMSAAELKKRTETIRKEYAAGTKKLRLPHFVSQDSDVLICLGGMPSQDSAIWEPIRNTFCYIDELTNKHSYDIDHWDLLNYFRDKDGNFIQDKRKLNALFMSRYLEEIKDVVPEHGVILSRGQEDCLVGARYRLQINSTKELKDYLASKRREASERYASYLSTVSSQVELEAALAGTGDDVIKKDIVAEIKKAIAAHPGLRYAGVSINHEIVFITRQDIILTERNKSAGIDTSANLGKFTFYLKPFSTKMFVMRYSGNVKGLEHCHPHVGGSGQPCLGTAQHQAFAALLCGDVTGVLNSLWAVMTNYNPGNPYVSLGVFKAKIKETAFKKHQRRFGGAAKSGWQDQALRVVIADAIKHNPAFGDRRTFTHIFRGSNYDVVTAINAEAKLVYAITTSMDLRQAGAWTIRQSDAIKDHQIVVMPWIPTDDTGDASLDNEQPQVETCEPELI